MNSRLNRFNNKRFVYICVCFFCLLFLAGISPALRIPILNTFKQPLNLLILAKREIGGMIFYHKNYILNERLNQEIDLLRQQANVIDEVTLENSRLKQLLSLKDEAPNKYVAARVISHAPDNWSSAIVVDRGSRSGIKRGMVSVTYLGLVGRVMETTGSTSKIVLINDPNLSVSGIVQRSRQEGLVSGTLGGYLMMRYLPKDADIENSDVIVTSGLTSVYPKGLLIGTVIGIGDEFSRLTRYAIIKPAVNLSYLEEVLIIVE